MNQDPAALDAPARWVQRLRDAEHLSAESLGRAQQLAASTATPLAAVLTRLGLVGETELAACTSECAALPRLDLAGAAPPAWRAWLPPTLNPLFCRHAGLLPLASAAAEGDKPLLLAVVDPFDAAATAAMRFALGEALPLQVATESELATLWGHAWHDLIPYDASRRFG